MVELSVFYGVSCCNVGLGLFVLVRGGGGRCWRGGRFRQLTGVVGLEYAAQAPYSLFLWRTISHIVVLWHSQVLKLKELLKDEIRS